MKKALIHIVIFFTLLLISFTTLILRAMIPNGYLYDNFIRSAETYKNQSAYAFNKGVKLNSNADNYADAILLNIAWNLGNNIRIYETLNRICVRFATGSGIYIIFALKRRCN